MAMGVPFRDGLLAINRRDRHFSASEAASVLACLARSDSVCDLNVYICISESGHDVANFQRKISNAYDFVWGRPQFSPTSMNGAQ
jgi:hypothetical protein